jgi:hypothetical protein
MTRFRPTVDTPTVKFLALTGCPCERSIFISLITAVLAILLDGAVALFFYGPSFFLGILRK